MTHAPKLMALMAYDTDALSEAGKARVERHLRRCDLCRQALAEIRAYDVVASEIRQLDAPTVEWGRMEHALRREARAQARSGAPWWLAASALAAAAALAIIALYPRGERPVETAVNDRPPAPSRVEDSATIEATVVAISGAPRRNAEPVALGDRLGEHDALELDAGALHANLGAETGFAVEGSGRLALTRMRHDGVELTLESGHVASAVRTGTSYDILAGDYRVRVQGTHFDVRHEGPNVAVTVDEGIVEILRGTERVALLIAPATWSSAPTLLSGVAQGEVITPRGLDEAALGWPVLRLPEDARAVRWELFGRAWDAIGTLAFRAPPGSYPIVGVGPNGERYEATIELADEGATLEERSLRRIRSAPRGGVLSPEQIQAVVAPQHRRLQQCYELEVRRGLTSAQLAFQLRVTVARDGSVASVSVSADGEAPPPLVGCLQRTAESWVFPEPVGGPATFNLPIDFRPRRR